jgi:hypothetical protein
MYNNGQPLTLIIKLPNSPKQAKGGAAPPFACSLPSDTGGYPYVYGLAT